MIISETGEDVDEGKKLVRIWLALSFGVLAVWAILGLVAYSQGPTDRGTFGDMFGGANALFAGLAFVGIIITVQLQAKELRLQRLELRETRKELEGQKKQLEAQVHSIRRQAADANFFRLLEIFRLMARTIVHPGYAPSEDMQYRGVQPDQIMGVEYWRLLSKVCQVHMVPSGMSADDQWYVIYRRWDTSLSPYFATLAEVLALIAHENSDVGKRWAGILRAQLGPQEMIAIFFHGLSPWGRIYLKGYIEEFGIFTYFSDDPVYRKIVNRDWYDPTAFLSQGAG